MELGTKQFGRARHLKKWLGVFCVLLAVLFLVNPSTTSAAVIVGETSDAGISYIPGRVNPGEYKIEDLTAPDSRTGSRGATIETRVAVVVFKLGEDFPVEGSEGYGVVGANLRFNMPSENVPNGGFNADLIGVRWNASSEVLPTDFYGGTLVQDNILTPSTPTGLINTDESGDQALASWLEAQYAAGAGAGDYVFLRLAYDADPYLSGNYVEYKIDMANNATAGNRPALTMSIAQTVPEASSSVLILVGAVIIRWSRNKKTL